jgi:hypothetical protein
MVGDADALVKLASVLLFKNEGFCSSSDCELEKNGSTRTLVGVELVLVEGGDLDACSPINSVVVSSKRVA